MVSVEAVGGCGGEATLTAALDALAPATAFSLGVAVDGTTLAVFVNGAYVASYTMSSACASGSVALVSSYATAEFTRLAVFDAAVSTSRRRRRRRRLEGAVLS